MNNKADIKAMLDYIRESEASPINFDEEGIMAAYQKNNDTQSLSIKILSIFGGLLASFTFMGFLFIAGLYSSDIGLLVFGVLFIAGSIWMNKAYDKIIMDTFSISAFIIGFILLRFGLSALKLHDDITSIIFIIVAFSTLCIVQNYILSFIAVLIINGSILTLIISNNAYYFFHVYVSLLTLITVYFFRKEAAIITSSKAFSRLYNPIRIGLIFSLVSGLTFLGKKGMLPVSSDYNWITSLVIIAAILYLITMLFDVLQIVESKHKIGIYIFSLLTLLPTVLSPAISGAILIILLSFMVNYKTGLTIGIVAFIYFIAQYYYDLHFTLLTKSILLFSSGVLFIALYLLTHKKLAADEKV